MPLSITIKLVNKYTLHFKEIFFGGEGKNSLASILSRHKICKDDSDCKVVRKLTYLTI